ncbi:MAG: type II toxin-antitoxin system RelE/ParE family toxin [Planctomycetaceae bacterium]|nr:type II toxin-antitoxin system RelE/ParE family toxin [Planctomycetaceae bacterium]
MAQVTWSPSSLADPEGIAEFISRDSPHYANLFVQAVVQHVEMFAELPRSGRIVPEYGMENLREFLYESYRIVYRIQGFGMEVAAVVHGARLLPASPPQ